MIGKSQTPSRTVAWVLGAAAVLVPMQPGCKKSAKLAETAAPVVSEGQPAGGKPAVMNRSEPFFCDIRRRRSCMNFIA